MIDIKLELQILQWDNRRISKALANITLFGDAGQALLDRLSQNALQIKKLNNLMHLMQNKQKHLT